MISILTFITSADVEVALLSNIPQMSDNLVARVIMQFSKNTLQVVTILIRVMQVHLKCNPQYKERGLNKVQVYLTMYVEDTDLWQKNCSNLKLNFN